jgi:hypothetical protein
MNISAKKATVILDICLGVALVGGITGFSVFATDRGKNYEEGKIGKGISNRDELTEIKSGEFYLENDIDLSGQDWEPHIY